MSSGFSFMNVLPTLLAVLIYLFWIAIIAFVVIFIVKAVKYFKRLERTVNEINSKLPPQFTAGDSLIQDAPVQSDADRHDS